MAKAQEVKSQAMASLAQGIENEKKEQWRVEGRHMLFDAKRVRRDSKTDVFPVTDYLCLHVPSINDDI